MKTLPTERLQDAGSERRVGEKEVSLSFAKRNRDNRIDLHRVNCVFRGARRCCTPRVCCSPTFRFLFLFLVVYEPGPVLWLLVCLPPHLRIYKEAFVPGTGRPPTSLSFAHHHPTPPTNMKFITTSSLAALALVFALASGTESAPVPTPTAHCPGGPIHDKRNYECPMDNKVEAVIVAPPTATRYCPPPIVPRRNGEIDERNYECPM